MNILRTEDKTTLKVRYERHHQAGLILGVALSKQNCFLVELTVDDFKVTLINSAADNRTLMQSEYPSLWDVIQQIDANRTFLASSRSDGGLCGQQVAKYLDLLMTNRDFTDDSFILDRDVYPHMNPTGKYYVIDGMHRLVAFGLATTTGKACFPRLAYYCTDRHFDRP